MASIVRIKRSSVQGKRPSPSDLSAGELALNTRDGKLFSSDGSAVFEVGANSASIEVGTLTVGNSSPYILPTSDGTSGQVLVTDGSGNVSFTTLDSGLSEAEVLELLPFTTGYTNNTIPVRDINVTTVDGTNISDADSDAFGVSVRDFYDNMEPTGRLESVDCGALT